MESVEMVQKEYEARAIAHRDELGKLGVTDVKTSVFRFMLIIFAGVSFYLYLDSAEILWIVLFLAFIVGFIIALRSHWALRKKIRNKRSLIRINENELACHKGDLSAFDGGLEFKDPEHLYSNDLDLFGPHSLYAHLNRTVTAGGRQTLAHGILNNDGENIVAKQEGIQELASEIDWRQEFVAAGMEVDESPNLKRSLQLWLQNSRSPSWLISSFVLYPLALLSIGLLINWFIKVDVQSFYWFGYSFSFNLVLVFFHFKWIKTEYQYLNGISKSLGMYADLLSLIEKKNFNSEELKRVSQRLKAGEGQAGESIKKLARLLDAFDQLNNVVALVFTNGLYLNHLNVLRNLYNWKKNNGPAIGEWLEAVAEFDSYISIANFAYNHPEYTYPKISAEVKFEAIKLGHPLLNASKRIDNDVSFKDYKYVVLTGSNMSGKSTMLRSIGVNLVLAKIGSPVCASDLTTYPFTILSSMKLADSLEDDRSYFQAEVLRLKRILNVLESARPCFVLLDEILRGTNSSDKKEGTRLFMEKLGSFDALGIVATHDIDIADLAAANASVYKARYFESTVVKGELHFDYILREGICTTPNATQLMKAQGII